jgi:hypothetical protein
MMAAVEMNCISAPLLWRTVPDPESLIRPLSIRQVRRNNFLTPKIVESSSDSSLILIDRT